MINLLENYDPVFGGVITVETYNEADTMKLLSELEEKYPEIEFQISTEDVALIIYKI